MMAQEEHQQQDLTNGEEEDIVVNDDEDSLFDGDGGDASSVNSETDDELGGDDGLGAAGGAHAENVKLMNVVRAMVILTLLAMALIGAEIVFIVTTISDERNFRAAYADAAQALIGTFYANVNNNLWVTKSLADQFGTTTSSNNDDEWPFRTFSNFQARCASSLHMSQASSIDVAPFVKSGEQRQEWEAYVAERFPLLVEFEEPSAAALVSDDDAAGAHYWPTHRSAEQGIYQFDQQQQAYSAPPPPNEHEMLLPVWQTAPSKLSNDSDTGILRTLFNLVSTPSRKTAVDDLIARRGASMSAFLFNNSAGDDMVNYSTSPRSTLAYPITAASGGRDQEIVATVNLEFPWDTALSGDGRQDLPGPLYVVLTNDCDDDDGGKNFSFLVDGQSATFLGANQQVDPDPDVRTTYNSSYEEFAVLFDQHLLVTNSSTSALPLCSYKITIYTTPEFIMPFQTGQPDTNRWIVLGMFCFMICIFGGYDCLVEHSQEKVLHAAQRSDAIVKSLFPESVRDRLYKNAMESKKKAEQYDWRAAAANGSGGLLVEAPKSKLKQFVTQSPMDQAEKSGIVKTNSKDDQVEPIADLFPNTTILFADIAGFTAWSSEREPSQVFTLLETIYHSMDKAAKRFHVFKVETVGDCYVAATGVPDPQDDHALIMARFARTCVLRFGSLTRQLEVQLGPGTSELSLRVGLHSGPVTAGVLRGQKSRFQLFGDTMNMAARMESNGMRNKVHLSADTANLLMSAGKHHWIAPRKDLVDVKGKGECQTYWLVLGSSGTSVISSNPTVSSELDDDLPSSAAPSAVLDASLLSSASSSLFTSTGLFKMACPDNPVNQHIHKIVAGNPHLEQEIGRTEIDGKLERLIDWNTDVLLSLLKRVMATSKVRVARNSSFYEGSVVKPEQSLRRSTSMVRDEVQAAIALPEYDAEVVERARASAEDVLIPESVEDELRDYVAAIASGYRRNAFHNFEHASHVILSANKLLKRILVAEEHHSDAAGITTQELHQHTYGIATDPIAQFAIVFSALVHDVGHIGVPNSRLAVEAPELADQYSGKSIAEQRSVDLAWDLLMLPHFEKLRACIYQDTSECLRFRGLVVNSVIATDIFDKELKEFRNSRWDLAFHAPSVPQQAPQESALPGVISASSLSSVSNEIGMSTTSSESKSDNDRKATIIIEHVIQASDVAHTMQHWHIYLKWNERLFQEMYTAFLLNRAEKDPSKGWYEGELWFFDNYVIPLAGKLRECGVFGVSSDEYLTYAEQNRAEWARKGADIVEGMIDKAKKAAVKMGVSKSAAPSLDAVKEDEAAGSDDKQKLAELQATVSALSATAGSDDKATREGSLSPPLLATEGKPVPTTTTLEVVAPPGPLGITVDTIDNSDQENSADGTASTTQSSSGSTSLLLAHTTTRVHQINQGSPMTGKLQSGDVIVAIDGIDTRCMSGRSITELMGVSEHNVRRLTIERRGQQ